MRKKNAADGGCRRVDLRHLALYAHHTPWRHLYDIQLLAIVRAHALTNMLKSLTMRVDDLKPVAHNEHRQVERVVDLQINDVLVAAHVLVV